MRTFLALCLASGSAFAQNAAPAAAPSSGEAFYESTIRPILRTNCFACHSNKALNSGLSVETRESLLHGGNRGPGVVPGDPRKASYCKWCSRQATSKCPPAVNSTMPKSPPSKSGSKTASPCPRPISKPSAPALTTGPSKLPNARHFLKSKTTLGSEIPSTASSSPSSKPAVSPLARGRPRAPSSAASPRPHRPAAHARRSSSLPRRHRPDAYERARRPPARLAPLRRTLGPPLARPRPLRRHQRLRNRRATAPCGATATGSSTPSTTTCRSTSSPSNNSPATCSPTPPWTKKSPPASIATRSAIRRRHRPRAVPRRSRRRPRQHHRRVFSA